VWIRRAPTDDGIAPPTSEGMQRLIIALKKLSTAMQELFPMLARCLLLAVSRQTAATCQTRSLFARLRRLPIPSGP
jgi:hypothetical protein